VILVQKEVAQEFFAKIGAGPVDPAAGRQRRAGSHNMAPPLFLHALQVIQHRTATGCDSRREPPVVSAIARAMRAGLTLSRTVKSDVRRIPPTRTAKKPSAFCGRPLPT
jgi:hypothetical protein